MQICSPAKHLARIALLSLILIAGTITSAAAAAAISQSYLSDEDLPAGTLVSSQGGQDNRVIPADTTTVDGLIGVAVGENSTSISLERPNDTVQVASTGVTEVFVTDLEGEIKSGDPVTVSPIKGVGMKATSAQKIIGIAQAAATFGEATTSVQSEGGKPVNARVGSVAVALQIAYYVPPEEDTIVPKFLRLFAESIAGKEVSLVRLVVSGLILLSSLIAVAVLLFSATHSTMVSIGRNPLARTSIYRGLWQVIAATLGVFIAGAGAAYFVLRF